MRLALLFAFLAAAGTAAAAKPEWKAVGETVNGNRVYVDVANRRSSGGVQLVNYRTVLKDPLETPSGAVTTLRSKMRVKCDEGTAAGIEVTLYEDEATNKVFARNRASEVVYRKEPPGSSADLVIGALCRK
jgi:hypothetical protein